MAAVLAIEAADWLAEEVTKPGCRPPMPSRSTCTILPPNADADDADLALSLGGDGTMLRSVRLLDGAAVPLLGINLGVLGYLTEVEAARDGRRPDRFTKGSDAGHWHLDERLMLDVVARSSVGTPLGTWRALNEAVVEKR